MKYLPQEVTLYYLIPSIRREMTLFLKDKGKNNKEIAMLLNITPSAVSQYLKNKRSKFYFDETFKKKIHKKTEMLLKSNVKTSPIKILNELVEEAKNKKVLCKIHKIIDDVPKKCNLC